MEEFSFFWQLQLRIERIDAFATALTVVVVPRNTMLAPDDRTVRMTDFRRTRVGVPHLGQGFRVSV
ncbi:MAG: hypothetical protein CSA65_02925 [Proteobacteria bacterium]|nr:MAG: hypothetical protein CSA65_02925 [Pseudomonadota bacterium]